MTRIKEIPPIVTHVGNKVLANIKAKGLKITNVAADCGLDEQALRRYIKGKQIMGIDKVEKIAKALDIEVGELFKDSDK